MQLTYVRGITIMQHVDVHGVLMQQGAYTIQKIVF